MNRNDLSLCPIPANASSRRLGLLCVFALLTLGVLSEAASDSIAQEQAAESTTRVVLASDVEWSPLNPARGDKGPQAANLWGDRTGTEATGFLVKFVDGFASPPHIHNITYRGVVIQGRLHNDDPDAAPMWMSAGSYWTQPVGETHITAARGSSVAYIEIHKGPYLVLPKEEASDSGERPINVDASNIVWLDASNITWIDESEQTASADAIKVAFLWGKPQGDQPSGTLIKLPIGFTGSLRSHGATFRVVVIEGRAKHHLSGATDVKLLEPGSYFGSAGKTSHQLTIDAKEACVLYIRSEGRFDVTNES